jgi:ketosteroid isomerase-like protein
MRELSPTSEQQADYVTWRAPERPAVSMRRSVMEGIQREVCDVFAAVPRRGAETGGILLGRREADRIVVDDFEPVPSEHRFGPSYRLSDADHAVLRETLQWFRDEEHTDLRVLGFYRSQMLPDFGLSKEDEELLSTHFTDAEDLVLMIRPTRLGTSVADFFMRRQGRSEEAFMPLPFPFTESAELPHEPPGPAQGTPIETPPVETPAAEPEVPIAAAAAESVAPEPVAISWPPPRPRLLPEPEPRPKSGWLWYTGAAVLGLVGGALGYLALRPDVGAASKPAPAPTAAAANAPAPPPVATPSPAAQKPPATPPVSAERTSEDLLTSRDSTAIRALLTRWSGALKHGDVQAATNCYAPIVSPYFSRQDVSRDAVRQTIRQSLARNGRLEIYRLSEIQIASDGADRAVATFRQHWQAAGRSKSAGEEQERMTLARNHGVWQIASEQEQKVYWARRPHQAATLPSR